MAYIRNPPCRLFTPFRIVQERLDSAPFVGIAAAQAVFSIGANAEQDGITLCALANVGADFLDFRTCIPRKCRQMQEIHGTIYKNKNRYWWAVRLPGEVKRKARPLIPDGDKYATKDLAVAQAIAEQLWNAAISHADIKSPSQSGTDQTKINIYHNCQCQRRLYSTSQAIDILKSLATEFRMFAAQGDLFYHEISLAKKALYCQNNAYDDAVAIEFIERGLLKPHQTVFDMMEWTDADDPAGQFCYELYIGPKRSMFDIEVLDKLTVGVARTLIMLPRIWKTLRCERLLPTNFHPIAVRPWWSEVLTNLAMPKLHPIVQMHKRSFSYEMNVDNWEEGALFSFNEQYSSIKTNGLIRNRASALRLIDMAKSEYSWVRSLESGFLRTSAYAIEWLLNSSIESIQMRESHFVPMEVSIDDNIIN